MTIFGNSFCDAFCVVPANPVTLQNKSYNGTAAKDKPALRKILILMQSVLIFYLTLLNFPVVYTNVIKSHKNKKIINIIKANAVIKFFFFYP